MLFYAICICTFESTPNTMTTSLSDTIPTSFRVGTMFAVIHMKTFVLLYMYM